MDERVEFIADHLAEPKCWRHLHRGSQGLKIENFNFDLRQSFKAGTWLGLGKIHDITVQDCWKQKGEVQRILGTNCVLMLPIEELMGLLGSSCHEQSSRLSGQEE